METFLYGIQDALSQHFLNHFQLILNYHLYQVHFYLVLWRFASSSKLKISSLNCYHEPSRPIKRFIIPRSNLPSIKTTTDRCRRF